LSSKDTFAPPPNAESEQTRIQHGTFFYIAQEEGLIRNTSVHGGIRNKVSVRKTLLLFVAVILIEPGQGLEDLEVDSKAGFKLITADDLDDLGANEIIRMIRERVGDTPVYLRWLRLLESKKDLILISCG
jgi:agmatinase